MTHRELEDRISWHELQYWLADYRIEPWGELRADVRAAVIAKVIADIHRGKGKRPFKLTDFMPFHRSEPPTMREKFSSFVDWAKRHNRRLEAKEKKQALRLVGDKIGG